MAESEIEPPDTTDEDTTPVMTALLRALVHHLPRGEFASLRTDLVPEDYARLFG